MPKISPDQPLRLQADALAVVPPHKVDLTEACQQQRLDRNLNYFGDQQFVFFYFEPRGDEVIWNDGLSYGFATGAWMRFHDDVAPLAQDHGVNVGQNNRPPDHVLLVDRQNGRAYFTARSEAEAFVALNRCLRSA